MKYSCKDGIDCPGDNSGLPIGRTLTVVNGHLVDASSVKLVAIYLVCFAFYHGGI